MSTVSLGLTCGLVLCSRRKVAFMRIKSSLILLKLAGICEVVAQNGGANGTTYGNAYFLESPVLNSLVALHQSECLCAQVLCDSGILLQRP